LGLGLVALVVKTLAWLVTDPLARIGLAVSILAFWLVGLLAYLNAPVHTPDLDNEEDYE
jgi:hypothetical protein